MRAVVVDGGRPRLADVRDPGGDGVVRVRACGLCGSDVEKLAGAPDGLVLGHEVVGETADGRRIALVHHVPCGDCERCVSGHESTCEGFAAATIEPGGFAELARARAGGVELPDDVDDVVGSYAEPLACVARGLERVPVGRVLVVGGGFVGRLFVALLRRRGDAVSVLDPDPARGDRVVPDGVDAAVICAPGGANEAAAHVKPAGTILVFAPAGDLTLDPVYRRELTVVGSRSATPRHLEAAVSLLPQLDLPRAVVFPLDRFEEGLELYRRREAVKVVFTP